MPQHRVAPLWPSPGMVHRPFRARERQAYRRATMRTHCDLGCSASAPLAVGLVAANARACRRSASRAAPRSSTATRSRSATRACACSASTRPRAASLARATAANGPAATKPRASCAALIGDRTVTCTRRDVDNYGRIVAVCRSGPTDLAAEMARSGFATAYRRYSNDYVDEENEARPRAAAFGPASSTSPEDVSPRRSTRSAGAAQRRRRSDRRARRLLHQGQHQRRRRAHLSRARLAVVRQHRHRREQRRALVLHGSRGAPRGLARATRLMQAGDQDRIAIDASCSGCSA